MGHLLVAEKIERAILFNLRASANPLFCSRVTRIIKKSKKYIFSRYSFYFYCKDIFYNAPSKNCYKISDVQRARVRLCLSLNGTYIVLYIFIPFFNDIINYLQMEIALKFYTTLYAKKTIFLYFSTCSIVYKKSSPIAN